MGRESIFDGGVHGCAAVGLRMTCHAAVGLMLFTPLVVEGAVAIDLRGHINADSASLVRPVVQYEWLESRCFCAIRHRNRGQVTAGGSKLCCCKAVKQRDAHHNACLSGPGHST